jgi:hypothetical protein
MRGAGLDTLGDDIRGPAAPRCEDLPWAEALDPASRTSPAAMFITAARELFLFSFAPAILHLLLFPGGILGEPPTLKTSPPAPCTTL